MRLQLANPCPWPNGYSSSHVAGWLPGEVRPVSPEVGGYLLSTFPEWFLEVASEGSAGGEEPGEALPSTPAPKARRKGA